MRTLSITLEARGEVVATFVEPTFKEKANLINMARNLARLTWTDMSLTACVQADENSIDVEWRTVRYDRNGNAHQEWKEGQEVEE